MHRLHRPRDGVVHREAGHEGPLREHGRVVVLYEGRLPLSLPVLVHRIPIRNQMAVPNDSAPLHTYRVRQEAVVVGEDVVPEVLAQRRAGHEVLQVLGDHLHARFGPQECYPGPENILHWDYLFVL